MGVRQGGGAGGGGSGISARISAGTGTRAHRQFRGTGVDEDAHLAAQRHRQRGARLHAQLGGERTAGCRNGRGSEIGLFGHCARARTVGERTRSPDLALELAEEHPSGHAAVSDLAGGEVVQAALRVALVGRVTEPQLHAVQVRSLGPGVLGVRDAGAGDHEHRVAGGDVEVVAGGIVVAHAPGEQPRAGGQVGVRVRGDVHRRRGRAEVIGEDEGADAGALDVRQGAPDGDGAVPAQRDLAGLEDGDCCHVTYCTRIAPLRPGPPPIQPRYPALRRPTTPSPAAALPIELTHPE